MGMIPVGTVQCKDLVDPLEHSQLIKPCLILAGIDELIRLTMHNMPIVLALTNKQLR
jgi:hypothetical protein